jgi:hypothetical protein
MTCFAVYGIAHVTSLAGRRKKITAPPGNFPVSGVPVGDVDRSIFSSYAVMVDRPLSHFEPGEPMNNFSYHNPVRIEFGKGSIAKLPSLLADNLSKNSKVLLLYGGGSIKRERGV